MKTRIITRVATRWQCGRMLHKLARSKNVGVITDVKLTRISLFIWHLQCKAEIES